MPLIIFPLFMLHNNHDCHVVDQTKSHEDTHPGKELDPLKLVEADVKLVEVDEDVLEIDSAAVGLVCHDIVH